ncbi:MAG: hypothetical protein AAB289_13955, partial [Chloroflexota bacterium]
TTLESTELDRLNGSNAALIDANDLDVILEGHLKAVNAAGDELCLTYEATVGDFEWQSCSAGAGDVSDVGDCIGPLCFVANGVSTGNNLYLEGAGADDAFEVQLTAANPAADVTLTLPGITGTLITTGDTGTVTGTMILNNTVALITDTDGTFVGDVAAGSGIAVSGTPAEGYTETIALGALSADWNQTGAFDLSLNNTASELKILEAGTTPTLFGIFDIADLSTTDKTYTFPDVSGTVYTSGNDPLDTIAEWQTACTDCVGSTDIGADSAVLATDTTGDYVATLAVGSGLSTPGAATGENIAHTLALGPLSADWNQTGAFDLSLNNSSSELKLLESGASPTFFGTLDVGDLAANATYTLSGASGTLLSSANYDTTLDSIYVNVGESPTAADITGSFSAGLSVGANAVALGPDTAGAYVETISVSTDLSVSGVGAETATAALGIAANQLDFDDLQNTLDLDAALTLNQTTNPISQSYTGTTGTGLSYSATALTSGSALSLTASSNPAAAGPVSQVLVNLTNANATTATTLQGLDVKFTNNPTIAGNTENVLRIGNEVVGAASDLTVNSLLLLDNADTLAAGSTIVDNALLITASGDLASTAITDAIDASDPDIVNALNLGANSILTAATTLESTELDRLNGINAALIDANDLDVILEGHLKAVNAAGDELCLTYEATVGDFEWQSCSAGAGDVSDVGDCAGPLCFVANGISTGNNLYLEGAGADDAF